MLQIQDTIISFDLLKEQFRCDLDSCQGQCCIEGDAGAPLEPGEPAQLEALLPAVWDDLAPEARNVIRRQGGMGDADTALQEDRGTDTTAGDRGGKAVKRRTRPSLSPGQDGRKITEKGWANNGPPLEVP